MAMMGGVEVEVVEEEGDVGDVRVTTIAGGSARTAGFNDGWGHEARYSR